MGHLVNPLSFRVYNIKYWASSWFTNNQYAFLNIYDILVKKFLQKVLLIFFGNSNGILFSHIKLLKLHTAINIYIYIHDTFLDVVMHNFNKRKKIIRFKKSVVRRNRRRLYNLTLDTQNWVLFITLKQIRFLLQNYLKRKFLSKFWNFFKRFCITFLNKMTPVQNVFNFKIVGLCKNYVNANIIGQFFYTRLKQYYTIWEILKSINFYLKTLINKKQIIKGYKIMFSGRFSRKQRTTYSWKNFGTLNTSSMKSNLDYTNMVIPLRYSTCSLKIWLTLNQKKINAVNFVV
jgi:ribosomal protein S3